MLTQRPPEGNRIEPVDYLFMADNVGATLNNPDLKPEKTVDYELGFATTLSLKSALKISAFYKELRDMIQRTSVLSAYPAQYYTYGNIDFGTVKGMSINYDLRRTNNIQLTANYTLQFADGTGSSATSGQSLVETGQPNLRTTIPLSYDQRHAISASVDYHYGAGKDYNGPVWFGSGSVWFRFRLWSTTCTVLLSTLTGIQLCYCDRNFLVEVFERMVTRFIELSLDKRDISVGIWN